MKPPGETDRSGRPDPALLREIAREIGEQYPVVHAGDRIVLTAVNPRLAYLSWHLDPASVDALRAEIGAASAGACLRVRVHDVTDILFDGTNAHATFEVEVAAASGREYWSVPVTDRNLLAEVGLLLIDGTFVPLARSTDHWFDRDRPSRRYELGGLLVSSAFRVVFPVESVLDAPVFERLGAALPGLQGGRSLRVAVVDVGLGSGLTGMVRQIGGEIGKLNAVVTLFVDDAAVDAGVDLVQAARGRGEPLFAALAAAHRRDPFDVVHCHEWYSIPVALRARELGAPVVLSLHSTEPERAHGGPPTDLSRTIGAWERQGVAAADLVVVPNAATRQQVIALYSADPGRVLTVPDVGDGRAPPFLGPARAKGALGIDAGAPVVLFAGELAHASGADLLAEAVPTVCRDHATVRFVFAGDGPLRAELVARLAAAGVGERCLFLGDVPAERFEAVLVASDYVVIPARTWQDEGLAVLSLARGKPVLTTRQANLRCVRHGENGLVTYDNPGSIVWGVRELLAAPLGDSDRRWRALTGAGRRPTLDRVTVEHLLAYETVASAACGASVG